MLSIIKIRFIQKLAVFTQQYPNLNPNSFFREVFLKFFFQGWAFVSVSFFPNATCSSSFTLPIDGNFDLLAPNRYPSVFAEDNRKTKAEMGGLCKERCEEGRRGGRLDEDDKRQRRVEKTSRRGGEKVAGSTSPLTKGKEEEEENKIVTCAGDGGDGCLRPPPPPTHWTVSDRAGPRWRSSRHFAVVTPATEQDDQSHVTRVNHDLPMYSHSLDSICRAMPHGNDLRNDIVDDTKSRMKFNDYDDIIQARHVIFDDIITIVEFHC